MGHLSWGTFTLRDVVAKNGGVSPFGNERVRYVGSADNAALNAAVPRFKPDQAAAPRFAFDVDQTGRFSVPVVSAHGIGDATVFIEGNDTLAQNFMDSAEHSYWGDAYYPPLFNALLNWVEKGQKPIPAGIATSCVRQPGPQLTPIYVEPSMTVPEASRSSMRAMTSRPVRE